METPNEAHKELITLTFDHLFNLPPSVVERIKKQRKELVERIKFETTIKSSFSKQRQRRKTEQ